MLFSHFIYASLSRDGGNLYIKYFSTIISKLLL